jgi:STE24 endopeptidase
MRPGRAGLTALLILAAGAAAAAAPGPLAETSGGGFPGELWRIALAAYLVLWGLAVAFIASGWHLKLRRRLEAAISVRLMVTLLYAFFVVAALHLLSLPFLLWQSRAYRTAAPAGVAGDPGWVAPLVLLLGSIGVCIGAVLGVYALLRRTPRLWWLWSALALCLGAELLTAGLAVAGEAGTAPAPAAVPSGALAAPPVAAFLRAEGVSPRDLELVRNPLLVPGGAAAYTPWFGRPRILVSASLGESGYTPAEVRFILAHELGHIRLGHGWQASLARLGQVLLILLAAGLAGAWIVRRYGRRLRIRSLADIESLPLLFLLLSAASLLTTPLAGAYSRYREVRADRYALEATGDVDAAVSYFRKIEAAPVSALGEAFRSHPSPESRIRYARALAAARPAAPPDRAPGG